MLTLFNNRRFDFNNMLVKMSRLMGEMIGEVTCALLYHGRDLADVVSLVECGEAVPPLDVRRGVQAFIAGRKVI